MKKTSIIAVLALLLGIAGAVPSATAAPPPQAAPKPGPAQAPAEATAATIAKSSVVYVRAAADGIIYNNDQPISLKDTTLLAWSGAGYWDGQSYMRFDVSGYAQRIQSAELELYSVASRKGAVSVGPVNRDWTASNYTFANRPTATEEFASGTVDGVGREQFDVTKGIAASAVMGDGIVDLALTPKPSDGSTYTRVASTELNKGTTAPRLKLTLAPVAAVVPSPQYLRIDNAMAAYPLRFLREIRVYDADGRQVPSSSITPVGDDAANVKRALDGSLKTAWRARSTTDAIILDLGKRTAISGVSFSRVGSRPQAISIGGSYTATRWETIGAGKDIGAQPTDLMVFIGDDATSEQVQGVATRTRSVESRASIEKRTGVPAGANDLAASSNVYVEKGSLVQIWAKTPKTDGTTLGYWIIGGRFPLKPGLNVFRAPYSGVILLRNTNDTVEDRVDFYVSASRAHRAISYFKGRGTSEQFWQRFFAAPEPKDPGQVDVILESSREIIAVPRDKMAEAYQPSPSDAKLDVEELMKTYDRMIAAEDRLLGLSTRTGGTDGFMRKREHIETGGLYMATTSYATKVNPAAYPSRVLGRSDRGIATFWGMGHEMGHTRDGNLKCFPNTGEGTPNLFAMSALKAEARAKGENWRQHYWSINQGIDAANKFRDKAGLDMNVWRASTPTEGNPQATGTDVRLMWTAALAQVAYFGGEDYWQQYFRLYRKMLPDAGTNELSKIPETDCQQVLYLLSRSNNRDFRPFYKAWGITVYPETDKLIDDLKLTNVFDPKNATRPGPEGEQAP